MVHRIDAGLVPACR